MKLLTNKIIDGEWGLGVGLGQYQAYGKRNFRIHATLFKWFVSLNI